MNNNSVSETSAIDYFGTQAIPVALNTPIHHEIRWLPINTEQAIPEFNDVTLNNDDTSQAARFVNPRHGLHFRLRRQFRRYCAGLATNTDMNTELPDFQIQEKGRPYLAAESHLHFSFSSCQSGLLAGWSNEALIGVDIEDRHTANDADDIADRFFSKAECRWLTEQSENKRDAFLSLWCLKEAALKCIGEGIPFGLDKFTFNPDNNDLLTAVPAEYGKASHFDAHLVTTLPVSAAVIFKK
jgi:4'-phosphopantetheinyl transferase